MSAQLEQLTIEEYLKVHENKNLLRFITCGSVDDGKSTLIGRLLHDTRMIYEDQLAALERDSKKSGTVGEEIDLALLVDGLQSEREQGITIDVAYRYFSTDRRKFIIADTPGHEQYTRNMATGASSADLAILLIDARHGVQTQTRRHSFIVKLLGIRHVVIAINKMDLVGFDQTAYENIRKQYEDFAEELAIPDVHFIPLSALKGDFVAERSDAAPWYEGPTLLEVLENVEITKDRGREFRFPVQYVNRPNLDFRGYCGTVASGEVRVGDQVKALPSGKSSIVTQIVTYDGDVNEAIADDAVTLLLKDEIDISRGDMIVLADSGAPIDASVRAHVVWMHEDPLTEGSEYLIKSTGKILSGRIESIEYKVDVNTLEKTDMHSPDAESDSCPECPPGLILNEIGLTRINLSASIIWDSYEENRTTGNFIIIDRLTNNTVGVGMIVDSYESEQSIQRTYTDAEIELNAYVRKHFPEWGCASVE